MRRRYRYSSVKATQLIFSRVFDRFPQLQIVCAENDIGWIAYL